MSLARRLVSGVALPLFLAACEDAVEPRTALNREESVALLKGAGATLGRVLEDSALTVFVSPDSTVSRCPSGGLAKWSGRFTRQTGDTARLVADVLVKPEECAIGADGIQFTINGAQRLAYFLFIEVIAATSEVNFAGRISGGLDWTLGDRSGDCVVDLTLDAVPDLVNQTLTGVYRGRVCNYWVETDVADFAAFLLGYL